jgi:hypothetical protein
MGGQVYASLVPYVTSNDVHFQFHGDTVDWSIISKQNFNALPAGYGQAVFNVGPNPDGTANAATFTAAAENLGYTIDFTLTARRCDPANNRVTEADATITANFRIRDKVTANTLKDYPLT